MDYSSHYQQQQQSTDPSAQQIQSYDPSAAQSYYPYPYEQYNPTAQQPYPYYDYGVQPQQQEEQQQKQPQPQPQEPKPPGVSDPSQQAQNQYYQYYQQAPANADYTGYAAQQQQGGVNADYAGYAVQQQQVYPWGGVNADGSGLAVPQQPIGPSYGGPGRMDGVPSQGAARGHFGHQPNVPGRPFGGRGRGRGRSNLPPNRNFGSAPMPQSRPAAPIAPAQPKVFPCELCKVECNTLDVLEKHKTGKKHLKNLKNHQDSQNRQVPAPQPVVVNQEIVESGVLKRKAEEEDGPELEPKPKKKSKKKKPLNSKNKTDPSIPKEAVVPLVCELCNVKCDTLAVFQIHMGGKKHSLKAKRFLSQNEILGQEVLKALTILQQNPSAAPGSGFIPGPETKNQILHLLEKSRAALLINDEGALNEKPLEFAGTGVGTDATELEGVSVIQPSVGVPSSGEVALTGSDDKIEPIESKGEEEPSAQ